MRAAIGLFALVALLGGSASAESTGIETAGLFTPLPTVSSESLLRIGQKIQCKCGKGTKTIEADYCPDGVRPLCNCNETPPTGNCPRARN